MNLDELIKAIGIDELAAFLALDDEHFDLVKETVLEAIEQSMSLPEAKIGLKVQMATSGISQLTGEDMDAVMEALDAVEDERFTPTKLDFMKRLFVILGNSFNSIGDIVNEVISVPFEICRDEAKVPTYAHDTDSGLDVYATEDISVDPGETVLVKTGIKVAVPQGYELQVRPKSGISLKTKLRVANTPGTIDAGYRDEIGIIIENIEPRIKDIEAEYIVNEGEGSCVVDGMKIKSIEYGKPYEIEKGQKIAQLVLARVSKANFSEVKDIGNIEGDRGGGFGSTGLK